MAKPTLAPAFPQPVVFPDVDAATLAVEDFGFIVARAGTEGVGAWHDYLRKVLPPLPRRAGAAGFRVVAI